MSGLLLPLTEFGRVQPNSKLPDYVRTRTGFLISSVLGIIAQLTEIELYVGKPVQTMSQNNLNIKI